MSETAMSALARNVQASQSPEEVQAAVRAYRQSILTDAGVGPDSPMWSGFQYSNPAVPWQPGLQRIPGSAGSWAPQGYAFNPGPGDMLHADPYALPELTDWPGGHIHGQPMPSTNGFFAKGTGLLRDAIAGKLALLQNPATAAAPPQPAAAPMNLGPGPLPGPGSTTPGVNTGLTAEQQRALMFQVA